MSVAVSDPRLVAVSSIKSAYLALFSLFGSTGGYDYVGGRALADVRRLLLDPVRYANQEAGKYVQSVPKDGTLAPEGRPKPDIMLVTEPHGCWMVRVRDHLVLLPLDGNGEESTPSSEWYINQNPFGFGIRIEQVVERVDCLTQPDRLVAQFDEFLLNRVVRHQRLRLRSMGESCRRGR